MDEYSYVGSGTVTASGTTQTELKQEYSLKIFSSYSYSSIRLVVTPESVYSWHSSRFKGVA